MSRGGASLRGELVPWKKVAADHPALMHDRRARDEHARREHHRPLHWLSDPVSLRPDGRVADLAPGHFQSRIAGTSSPFSRM
jgi:hypothetical protein